MFERDNFQLESIMTDFEAGTINSVKEILPNILHKSAALQAEKANLNSLLITGCLFLSSRATSSKQRIAEEA